VLDSRWSAWFDGLQMTSDQRGHTVIAGPVTDQAALHGLLAKVRDLAWSCWRYWTCPGFPDVSYLLGSLLPAAMVSFASYSSGLR